MMTNTHEWYAPGIPPQIDRIQNFPSGHFPWMMSRMKELRPVHIPDVNALPEEAAAEKKEFQIQEIQSLLCLPIYNDHRKLIGFMGFDAVRSSHDWQMEQIVMLQMLAEILGSAIFRLEALHALIKSEKKLQKANAEKDKLLGIIAHDLKSPMSGLIITTELLANHASMLSEQEIQHISSELHKSTKNTFSLLENLLQWARMSQGGIDYAPTPCNLQELINMNLTAAQDIAQKKDIAIRSDIPQGLVVLIDQSMINSVTRNLLFNAIKFSNRGGDIAITAQQKEQVVVIAIEDNGIGMDQITLSSIFSIAKAKSKSGTEGEKGTGLGLVLCKQFIEQHSGKIWVESTPGQGTTVFFTLPISD